MKKLFILLISVCTITYSNAQNNMAVDSMVTNNRYEIGLMSETSNVQFHDISIHAIRFNKWKNDHFGIRALLGYGMHSGNQYTPEHQLVGDTTYRKQPFSNGNMGIVGLGVEARRMFYKRICLSAAIELKAGYGKASIDTFIERNEALNGFTRGIKNAVEYQTPKGDLIYIGLTPTIGLSFLFKRIGFGTELAWNVIDFTNIDNGSQPSVSNFVMDVSNFNPRLFINYRF